MNILITGINGFVGSNLVAALKAQHTIYGLDILSLQKEGVVKTYKWDELKLVCDIDIIIHLAAIAHDTKNKTCAEVFFNITTGLTQKIYDWFLSSEAKKFIFFSTVKSAADKVVGDILTEDVVPSPRGPYGESKIAAEKYILSRQLAVGSQQSAVSSQELADGSQKLAVSNKKYAVNSRESGVKSSESAVGSQKLAVSNKKSTVNSRESGVKNSESAVGSQQSVDTNNQFANSSQEFLLPTTNGLLPTSECPLKLTYILRPCMIHGPGNKGNLNLLYKVVMKGIPYPLGAFENRRSFCSIDNLSFVISELIEKEIASGIYNVGDDESLSTNELIILMATSINKPVRIWKWNKTLVQLVAKVGTLFHLPLNTERLHKLTDNYVVSNAKIKQALGIDKMPFRAEDGFKKTVKSF